MSKERERERERERVLSGSFYNVLCWFPAAQWYWYTRHYAKRRKERQTKSAFDRPTGRPGDFEGGGKMGRKLFPHDGSTGLARTKFFLLLFPLLP